MDIPESIFYLFLLFLVLLSNALCTLFRTALLETPKGQLEESLTQDEKHKEKMHYLYNHTEDISIILGIYGVFTHFIVAILVFKAVVPLTMINLVAHFHALTTWHHPLTAVALIVFFLLDVFFTMLFPARLAKVRPIYYVQKYLSIISIIYVILKPLLRVANYITNLFFIIIGVNIPTTENVTEDEVKDLIERGREEGTFEKEEQEMVDRIFHMSDQTAYSLMTPRTQMLWLDLDDPLEENLKLITQNPDTIFWVGRDNLDNFSGLIYAKDLLNEALYHPITELTSFIKKPMFLPRSMETFRVLEKFRDNDIHEAIVIDEFGGVVGFITLRDIIEEIIGDIAVNTEDESLEIVQRNDNSWYVDGLCEVDDFKEKFDIDKLPDEDKDHYQTMGGFLLSFFGYIPRTGEYKVWNNYRFEVADMDRNRIDKILLTILQK